MLESDRQTELAVCIRCPPARYANCQTAVTTVQQEVGGQVVEPIDRNAVIAATAKLGQLTMPIQIVSRSISFRSHPLLNRVILYGISTAALIVRVSLGPRTISSDSTTCPKSALPPEPSG